MNSSQDNVTPYDEMFNSGVIQHSLDLVSVYDKTKANGEQEASSFQDYWVTVDYIYFRYYLISPTPINNVGVTFKVVNEIKIDIEWSLFKIF